MDANTAALLKDAGESANNGEAISRRNFAKKLLGVSALSSLGMAIIPQAAMAWLDGAVKTEEEERSLLRDLLK